MLCIYLIHFYFTYFKHMLYINIYLKICYILIYSHFGTFSIYSLLNLYKYHYFKNNYIDLSVKNL